MSAALPSPPSFAATLPAAAWREIKRRGALGPIVVLHIAVWYALQTGMTQPPKPAPKEVFATLIAPEMSQPSQPKPQPAAPKIVRLENFMPPVPPVVLTINTEAASNAITVPVATAAEPPAVTAPSAPAPTAPAQPRTISSGVAYLQAPQPEYPQLSRRIGEEGKVLLRILVNEKGQPERIEIQKSSGSPRLDDAARQAVARAVFKPYIDDGKAVAVYALVPISFQLNS